MSRFDGRLIHTCHYDREGRCSACASLQDEVRAEAHLMAKGRAFVDTQVRAGRMEESTLSGDWLRLIRAAIAWGRDARAQGEAKYSAVEYEAVVDKDRSYRFGKIEVL